MNDSNKSLKAQLASTQDKLAESEQNYLLLSQQIKKAHQEWMSALDILEDPIFIHDEHFLVVRCNLAYQKQAGVPYKQIIGHPYFDIFPKTHAPLKNCLPCIENSSDNSEEETLQEGDLTYHSRAYVIRDKNQNYLYSVHILEDITERIKIQKALQTSETQYRRLFEAAKDGILILDALTGLIVDANPFILNLTDYALNELIGKNLWEIGLVADIAASKVSFEVLQTNDYVRYEDLPLQTKDGHQLDVEFVSNIYLVGSRRVIQCNIRDISQRKKDQASLQMFRTLLDHSSDAIEVLDAETLQYVNVNETACRVLGYTRDELLSLHIQDVDCEIRGSKMKELSDTLKNEGSRIFETTHRRKDGSVFPVEVSISLVQTDKEYAIAISRDITERKLAEKSLSNVNRALKTLSAVNMALVQAKSEDLLLQHITKVIVKQGGYNFAAVDYAENNPQKSITPMAWAGCEDVLDCMKDMSWSKTAENQLPVSKAIRTATTQVTRDIGAETEYTAWREAALAQGYASCISLPLMDGNKVFGALNIYSSETDVFEAEEVQLLKELADDLAYGIIALRTRKAHEQQELVLRDSLEQSIQTIAATVEARDPYTAGHQKRVAELATAIATEMKLEEDQVNGIHLAAIIHDLGKIHIPAEILSKPGKLSDIEFLLIQTHPQAGYDILKDVKFPWPIADIILQHHEKLDGSGYPQGLKGDQILLEAKILTVADVVEAISAHRPYRASLGIEFALEEIKRGSGVIYDAAAVDACLTLFEKKGFTFSEHSNQ